MAGGYVVRRLLRRSHCNGADQAALKLARLGRPVKIMIGGITGWADEGLPFAAGQMRGRGCGEGMTVRVKCDLVAILSVIELSEAIQMRC